MIHNDTYRKVYFQEPIVDVLFLNGRKTARWRRGVIQAMEAVVCHQEAFERREGHLFYWRYAFAALKEDGTVEAWGDSSYGGSGVPSGLSGVKAIYSTYMPLLP